MRRASGTLEKRKAVGVSLWSWRVALVWLSLNSCSPVPMPAPEDAAQAYREALERGDAEALHGMMTSRAREALSKKEVSELLKADARELKARAQSFVADSSRVESEAIVFLGGQRRVRMTMEQGVFFMSEGGGLPRRPHTVEEAVALLGEGVKARDFDLVLSLLSEQGQHDFEDIFLTLDRSFEQIDSAIFDLQENHATVEFPDGLIVELRRYGEVWRVEELR